MLTQKTILTSFVSFVTIGACTMLPAMASLQDLNTPLSAEMKVVGQSASLAPQTLEELSALTATGQSFKSLDLRALTHPKDLFDAMSLLLNGGKVQEIEELSLFTLFRNHVALKEFFEAATTLKKFHLTMGATFVFLPQGTPLSSVKELELGHIRSAVGIGVTYDARLEPLEHPAHFQNMERLEIVDATQQYDAAAQQLGQEQAQKLYFTTLIERANHYFQQPQTLQLGAQKVYPNLTYARIPSSFIPLTLNEPGGKFLAMLAAPALNDLIVVNESGEETTVQKKPNRNWLETVLYKIF